MSFLQMRPSFVISLMLLFLILTKCQGIRLEKGSLADQQHKQQDEENKLLKGINSSNNEAIIWENEQYYRTGKIKIRKHVTSSTSTTHDISKNVKNGGKEAEPPEIGYSRNYEGNGEEKEILINKQHEHSQEHYPDLVDIADMDYYPSNKNPPLHN
ncbi:hypothetical protein Fmac_020811 [Flemingia macrophylla]|uniref:Uncharacterized protein n=1 Tax=Flemingia macrophylla TaxID=520843 RepID=A0ABD1LV45_9FABA